MDNVIFLWALATTVCVLLALMACAAAWPMWWHPADVARFTADGAFVAAAARSGIVVRDNLASASRPGGRAAAATAASLRKSVQPIPQSDVELSRTNSRRVRVAEQQQQSLARSQGRSSPGHIFLDWT